MAAERATGAAGGRPTRSITTPLTDEVVESLRAGDRLLITGTIYTGRDAAHKRLVALIDNGEPLPIDIRGQVIYFVGPTPPKPVRSSARPVRPPRAAWTPTPPNCLTSASRA